MAANVAALEERVGLFGIIGDDANGNNFCDLCVQSEVRFFPIVTSRPTITKRRCIETTYHQQLLRIDYESVAPLTDAEETKLLAQIPFDSLKVLVCSDYLKGIFTPSFVSNLLIRAKENGTLVLVDAKPKTMPLFYGAYLIKPNLKEFSEIMGENITNDDATIEKYGKKFVEETGSNLVVTRSAKGVTLITTQAEVFHIPALVRDVFDVTGAGDTVIAAIAYALKNGYSLPDAVKLGNKASGMVVGKMGTATVSKKELGL